VLDPRWSEPLRAELQWLGEQLGRVRDADVLLVLLDTKSDELQAEQRGPATELIERRQAARQRDRDQLLEAMRSDRYTSLLDRLIEATRAPRFKDGNEDVRAAKVVRKVTRRPWKRLRKGVARLPATPDDRQLHEVRKRAKQARYALEAVSPITGSHTRKVAKRLADLQDVLGDHQDAVVASQWLHEAALDSGSAETAFVAGVLAGSFAADRRRLRTQWMDTWKRAQRAHRGV
jgi:CHAD domain-containing protein